MIADLAIYYANIVATFQQHLSLDSIYIFKIYTWSGQEYSNDANCIVSQFFSGMCIYDQNLVGLIAFSGGTCAQTLAVA